MTRKKIEQPTQTPGPVQPRRKAMNYDPFARRKTHPIRELFEAESEAETPQPEVPPPPSNEAEKPNPMATHEVQGDGYPQKAMGSMLPMGSTQMGSMLPIGLEPFNPMATPKLNPMATHKVKGKQGKRRSNEKQFSIRVDADLLKRVLIFCQEQNLTHKEFYELVATHTLERRGYPLTEIFPNPMGSMLPHDDMMIFTTIEDIIMRYQKFTLRTWTRRDDRVGVQFNDTNPLILDIAFITTIEKKLRGNTATEPVKSFNYFAVEIQSLVAAHNEHRLPIGLSEYHRYCVHKWETEILPLRNKKWRVG